jgi:hypothetical protein
MLDIAVGVESFSALSARNVYSPVVGISLKLREERQNIPVLTELVGIN